MPASELQIYNLAVDAVGGTGRITDTDEESRPAELCRRWYGPVSDKVLAAAHWATAKRFKRLALLTERADEEWTGADPSPGYSYAFSCPADLLAPRHLTDYAPFDYHRLSNSQQVISCHSDVPILVYTSRIDPAQMEHELFMAIVSALAAAICSPLSGQTTKARLLLQEANKAIEEARVSTANLAQQTTNSIPDFIAARGYGSSSASTLNYVYPFGSFLSAGDIGG